VTNSQITVHDQLRAWARGLYTTEAATELIIRAFNGRFATTGQPWIRPTDHGHWTDFDAIPEHLGALSGGEQRLLRIAASIGSSDPLINLGDDITGLDRSTLHLVLAAIAHTGGSHEQSGLVFDGQGREAIVRESSLQPLEARSKRSARHEHESAPGARPDDSRSL
jgi:hypothetical protein